MDAATLLRTARLRRGLTQSEVAARARTSQPVVSAYEHGAREPSVETLRRLIGGTGERLVIGLAERVPALPPLATPERHAAALVDVLLLADAVPRRTPPARVVTFPRMDSSSASPPAAGSPRR